MEDSINDKIDFVFVAINIMLHQSLAESADHFWWPAELENVANLDFENLKHLKTLDIYR